MSQNQHPRRLRQVATAQIHFPVRLNNDIFIIKAAQRELGYPAFRESSNTVIVTGPSKTADIGHQLVKGAHGPREVHVMVLSDV